MKRYNQYSQKIYPNLSVPVLIIDNIFNYGQDMGGVTNK
jgi:hypothetical protein